jgi:hypothetical protein
MSRLASLSTKAKVFLALGLYLGITLLLILILGNEGKNESFQPQNEFKLDPWVDITIAGIDSFLPSLPRIRIRRSVMPR